MELQLKGITKRFPGVLANDRVDLTVKVGEILGLLGENGAGKTTLMNILYGLYSADEGEILIDGKLQHFAGPGDAIAAGIGMVHQHFMLVPVFTVTENVVLGVEPTLAGGVIDLNKARADVARISKEYGLEVDPDAIVEDLPVGVQQRVEIIKVLFRDARYLVFDEPTAVLTPQEVTDFFRIVRSLEESGRGIVFITHKLGEVLEISDRINVLRRGRIVGEAIPGEIDESELAELMVGRPVELTVHKAPATPKDPILEVTDLIVVDDFNRQVVDTVSFKVRSGEIVGIAGVQGNGQSQLVEAITGLMPVFSGSVVIDGNDLTKSSPRQIHDAGVAHVPEDRQRRGLVLSFTVAENMVLNSYHEPEYSSGFSMKWDAVDENAEKLVSDYDVRTPGIHVPVSNLSGGNQQKVIVAREFGHDVRLVVASQPTRGLDVGSIEYIHERIVQERDEGSAILIVSTELEEIMALSDRILVMYRGKIVAETTPEESTITDLGLYMAGSSPRAGATKSGGSDE